MDIVHLLHSLRDVKRRHRRAFTLVEVMILVGIIGLLAVISVPQIQKARIRSEDMSFVSDLRLLAQNTFELYAYHKGDFPPDRAPGVQPPGLDEYLPRRFHWNSPTPIGGEWDWNRAPTRADKVNGCYAALGVHRPRRTSSQMKDIDALLDDGDLFSGAFRRTDEGYMYVVER